MPEPLTVSVTPCWNDASTVPDELTASILNITLFPTTALDVTFAKMNFVAPGPAGAGLIVKITLPDVPPPGAGLKTDMLDVPAATISPDVITAVIVEDDTNVVVRDDPFHCTVELPTKFVPVTVKVKSDPPAIVEVGEIETIVGTGFAAAVIVNVCALDMPPPGVGFATVTEAVPVAVTSAARIVAVTWVEET